MYGFGGVGQREVRFGRMLPWRDKQKERQSYSANGPWKAEMSNKPTMFAVAPNICARILFIFVFAHSEKMNIIRIRIRSKF